MRFEEFAKEHGLIIDNIVPFRWVATPTTDHPKKKNGRYKFMGDHGFVQNWATMQSVAVWQAGKDAAPIPNLQKQKADYAAQRQKDAAHNSEPGVFPFESAACLGRQQASVHNAADDRANFRPQ